MKEYFHHLKAHCGEISRMAKCALCDEHLDGSSADGVTNHLFTAHGIGMYQCVYCAFGTPELKGIDDHLAENHDSEKAMFCQRSRPKSQQNQNLSASEVLSMSIQKVGKTSKACVITKIENGANLRNEQNVGIIGKIPAEMLDSNEIIIEQDDDEEQFTLICDENLEENVLPLEATQTSVTAEESNETSETEKQDNQPTGGTTLQIKNVMSLCDLATDLFGSDLSDINLENF
jgi:hypothetical protein